MAAVASLIAAMCICRQKEFESHLLAKTNFLVDLFEQCFRIFMRMILSLCRYQGQPCFQAPCSSQAHSKGSYSQVLLALPLESLTGAGSWPGAPLTRATALAGKSTGCSFFYPDSGSSPDPLVSEVSSFLSSFKKYCNITTWTY